MYPVVSNSFVQKEISIGFDPIKKPTIYVTITEANDEFNFQGIIYIGNNDQILYAVEIKYLINYIVYDLNENYEKKFEIEYQECAVVGYSKHIMCLKLSNYTNDVYGQLTVKRLCNEREFTELKYIEDSTHVYKQYDSAKRFYFTY